MKKSIKKRQRNEAIKAEDVNSERMEKYKNIKCRKCDSAKFDYDSYWKEYTCVNCGWIVQNSDDISFLEVNWTRQENTSVNLNRKVEHQNKLKVTKSKKNSRKCDNCDRILSSPDGHLLDASEKDLKNWHKLSKFANLALKAGASGVSSQSDPFWFVCEECLSKVSINKGVPVTAAIEIMSGARAIHLWENEEWSRPMLPADFPPETDEEQLPWMSSALEEKWKKKFGPEPPLDHYLATRASILARLLVQKMHKASYQNVFECVTEPVDFAVVVKEMSGREWDKCLPEIVECHLLNHVSATTKLWFASYLDAAQTWFSYRMLPYVATSILNVLDLDDDNLHYVCRIDNRGRRFIIILGK